MTQLVLAVRYDIIREAINSAEPPKIHEDASHSGLHGSPLSAFDAAISEASIKIKDLVEKCAREGVDKVRSEITAFSDYIHQTTREVGARAQEFEEWVLEKIRELIGKTFDLLLRSLRNDILVGNQTFVLDSIDLTHKLVYSGSIKVSLTALCEFAGGGELAIKGAYKPRELP